MEDLKIEILNLIKEKNITVKQALKLLYDVTEEIIEARHNEMDKMTVSQVYHILAQD